MRKRKLQSKPLTRKHIVMTTLFSFLRRVFGAGSLAGRRTAMLQAAAQAF